MYPLLPGYGVPDGHYDELLAAPRTPRPQWAAFGHHAGDLSPDQLSRAQARIARQIHENGVTYNLLGAPERASMRGEPRVETRGEANLLGAPERASMRGAPRVETRGEANLLGAPERASMRGEPRVETRGEANLLGAPERATLDYAAPGGSARPWALDVLPQIVPVAEWPVLARGLRQRARLLEAMVADIYGEQRLLTEGVLPPALVFGHPGFLRACHGVRPAAGVFLHLVAFDLGRGPDGRWRVVETRSQAPSGAGYALENRITVSRLFPDAFRELHVARLAPFFRTLQETLLAAAPHGDLPSPAGGRPHVVLLTPGPFNETYFEHAYLARYLGFTLAEGGDLTVRDDRVFLKTIAGLRPVRAILRRLDDAFCDPVELRADSTLGVPGLVQAWRAGHVLVANAFGSGVVESPDLQPFLPEICQRLLGEPLDLPSSREADLPLSYAPVWHDERLESRALMLRAFLVSDGRGEYRVMSGGLSRIAGGGEAGDGGQTVSSQRGGSSKDTWVLSDAPVERVSLLAGRPRGGDIAGSERLISSRAGEHLFWLGRYAERSENSARLLRAVLSRLHDSDAVLSRGSRPIVRTCQRHDLLRLPANGRDVAGANVHGSAAAATDARGRTSLDLAPHDLEIALIDGMADADTRVSLAFNIQQTARVGGAVRDRLSSDNWRVLNHLARVFSQPASARPRLAEALELLDDTILSLVAVGGLEMAHMTRDDGWRLLSLGRHLERLLYVTTTVGEVARAETSEDPALLEWLLDLSDSIITYRARYMRQPEWLAVVELLLFDPRNPRSAAFQLAKLAKHVRMLPAADLGELVLAIERAGAAHVADPAQGELFLPPDAVTSFLDSCEHMATSLSDALTRRYFSHVTEAPHATALL
jgi:uncharacterized circularly permuted ATP-grasp superfamily protein/uncharacterized alpha-E superfamily protein